MRKILLAVLYIAAAFVIWLHFKARNEPAAAGVAPSSPKIVNVIDYGNRKVVTVVPLKKPDDAAHETAHLNAGTVDSFAGDKNLVVVNVDNPFARDMVLFLHNWKIQLPEEQRRQIEEAYIRLCEARVEYEATIQTVDKSVPDVVKLTIPAYPESGKALTDVFQTDLSQILPPDQTAQLLTDFKPTMDGSNAGMGTMSQEITITKNADGTDNPLYKIDQKKFFAGGSATTGSFILLSQFPQSAYAYLSPFLPK